ncbi:MAG TPA: prepilin peptidase [Clostridia bacterium]|nr:prepilin peptidase [Clostridia bacterium]
MNYIFVFIIGFILGSFFNVCIYRISRKQSIIFLSPYCPECNYKIPSYDLIPVINYFFLRGRCRNCKDKNFFQYLLVKLISGFLYVVMFNKFGLEKELIVFLFLMSLLIIISFIDLYFKIIPNSLVLLGGIVGVPLSLWRGLTIQEIVLGSLVGFLIMLSIALVSKGGMGGGDVKLVGMLGLYLGWRLILITLFLSFLVGAVGGIILIMLKIKDRKDYIPFGPFIAFGAMLAVLFGFDLMNWYLNFL